MISDWPCHFWGIGNVKKLQMILKTPRSAADCLVDLWINNAQNHPDGKLEGMDAIDIVLDAGWDGDPDEFVKGCGNAGCLEVDGI